MKNYINIICILDRSGSMSDLAKEAINGFNMFLEDQKNLKGNAKMSILLFDNEFIKLVDNKNIKKVEPLNDKTYVPRNSTSLYDAIGLSIDEEIDKLSKIPLDKRATKTLVVITTDGFENSSRKYNGQKIKEMITDMRDNFKWEFIFLAANQDAMFTADNLGISRGNSLNFSATEKGVKTAYVNISKATSYYRTTNQDSYENIFKDDINAEKEM